MNDEIRQLFPITQNFVYLNHAAVSPPPTIAVDAVLRQLKDVQTNGSLNYLQWLEAKENCRKMLAQMINCEAEQIAFLRNTSDALSTVANGLTWRKGENIVTFQNEFPSNVYAWRQIRDKFGVELRFCAEREGRFDVEEFCSLIDENTRVVTISAVQYASGFRADLHKIAEIARKFDALFVVDTIQALGVVPIDVNAQMIDVIAGACHKWLLTPEGVGYLYLSVRARKRIEPTLIGWVSVKNPEDYANFEQEFRGGAMAWETGTSTGSLFYALEANLTLFHQIGVKTIFDYLIKLNDYLCENLDTEKYEIVSSSKNDEKSPIVCLRNREGFTAYDLYKHLQKRNIIVASRGDRLRISPHFYNNEGDIEKLIEALP